MSTSLCMRNPAKSRLAMFAKVAMFSLAMGVLALSGCGTGSSVKPNVGPIVFTDINGVPLSGTTVSLTENQYVYTMVTLTNDTALLGTNWTVSCASALPPGTPLPPGQTEDLSCGSFTPGHTMSGPVPTYAASGSGYVAVYTAPAAIPTGGTVTLIASSTADPTQTSRITLNILP